MLRLGLIHRRSDAPLRLLLRALLLNDFRQQQRQRK
ncbi:Protein of unknown function [Pyronema omphalodes CBS 100304]|uniref:Uncharacterized protein n=1 Tax=Pyronema omphalodes (strain CBS 100304) TaxID=1076935 RepID=U4LDW8_PYROM|nr:Protein of unknown function [Pyronema omphalodes CBS 100304]